MLFRSIAEKGSVLLSVDYSQIELRLAAEMAGIEPLREAFRAGVDIHAVSTEDDLVSALVRIVETRKRRRR